jgi:hypothetical protein
LPAAQLLLSLLFLTSGQHTDEQPAEAPHAREATPSHAQPAQQPFLDMFARSWYRDARIQSCRVKRFHREADQDVPYTTAALGAYDVAIPLML